ncbi:MAG: flagellar motor switch protein FliM, partial [Deltaproteobacteria bacterium]|nr:flagellar motor switch protein FliM [Deltaproteobacteria bacterium]
KAGITLERSSLGKLMKEHQKDLLALVQPMIEDFEKSWLNIADVELNLNRVTIYPQRAKVMLPYEYCFVGSVQLSVQDIQSEILLCLPYSGIDPLLSHLENKSVIAPESIENYSPHVKRHFMDILEKKEYSVVAELGNADLGGTKGKLEVGQLLPLLGKENLATIRINGTPVLQGYTGESEGHYSIQVTRRIEDKKPSAIQEEMAFKQVTWPSQ